MGVPLAMVGAGLLGGAANVLSSASQMRFQERMSSTAHQREVRDLKLAGLNPILSGIGGAGASSPSGSMPDVAGAVGSAVGSAQQALIAKAELKLLKEQIHKVTTEADSVYIDKRLKEYMLGYPGGVENPHMYIERNEMDARRRRANAEADISEFGRSEAQAVSEVFDKIGKEGAFLRMLAPILLRMFRR